MPVDAKLPHLPSPNVGRLVDLIRPILIQYNMPVDAKLPHLPSPNVGRLVALI